MGTSGIRIWEIGQDTFGSHEHLSLLKTICEQVSQTTPLEPELAQLNVSLFPNPFSGQPGNKCGGSKFTDRNMGFGRVRIAKRKAECWAEFDINRT